MRVALTAQEAQCATHSVPLEASLSDLIKCKLNDANIGIDVLQYEQHTHVSLHGPLYKLVGKEEFERAGEQAKRRAVPIRNDDEFLFALPTVWNSMICVLKLGPLALDVANSRRALWVTRDSNYSKPLGTITFESEDHLSTCFQPAPNGRFAAPPPESLLSIAPRTFQTDRMSGSNIPGKFANLLAIYLEHALRLHVLFSARAKQPRRVLLEGVSLIDYWQHGSAPSHTVSCKFHVGSGHCLCEDCEVCEGFGCASDQTRISLSIRMCGGQTVGAQGYCGVCGKTNPTATIGGRCTARFASILGCKHEGRWKTKRTINDEFLRDFASVCVRIGHCDDNKALVVLYDNLEARMDERIIKGRERANVSEPELLIYDRLSESMLATGDFRYNAKYGSLSKRGGRALKWHKSVSKSHGHLFPLL
tara:strand:- start:317 stop:1576 length:1260 start_codon:yes stop_codon:yes gene_type:complete